jgi:hypothetical protein
MNNNLILFADHLYNLLNTILKKYNNGCQLTEDEEQILWELWTAKEENNLQTINNKFKQ